MGKFDLPGMGRIRGPASRVMAGLASTALTLALVAFVIPAIVQA